jgi:hypothetical protein
LDVPHSPALSLYSKVPEEPVAFTTIVPVGTAQVGCVTVGAVTTGKVLTVIEPVVDTFPQPPVSVTV